jgi:lysozyme family protein
MEERTAHNSLSLFVICSFAGGVVGRKVATVGDPALWQGVQTKGKGKEVRGTKAMNQQSKPAVKQSGAGARRCD